MRHGPDIAALAALMGDPSRATILTALMNGQALTATELAREVGVAPQTASGHLAQLLDGGLVAVERQGRHRYYRLADAAVAHAVETLLALGEEMGRKRVRTGPKDAAMRDARVCYDHLAGARGVALFERMSNAKLVALDGPALALTPDGRVATTAFGLDLARVESSHRPLCRTCLDWSERKPHLAGALGAAILDRLFALDWASREPGGRTVRFKPAGEAAFAGLFTP